MVSVSDSRSRGPGFDSRPVHRQATTLGKLLTPMCLCHQAVQFGTGQRAVMLCRREGNRLHLYIWLFSGLSTLTWINGLTAKVREMRTPPTPIWAWYALPVCGCSYRRLLVNQRCNLELTVAVCVTMSARYDSA